MFVENLISKNCPVCKSRLLSHVYKLEYGDVVLCQKCFVAFTQFNDINTFRKANKTWNSAERIKGQIYMLPESRNEAEKRLKLLLKFNPGNKFVEFGPNTGEFLYVAGKASFDVTGVDHCSAVLSLNKSGNLKFIDSEATKVTLNEKYDVVAAFHLLEHLEEPTLFIKRIKDLLSPGGILFLEVPNYGSRNRNKQKEKWKLFFDYHFTHFDLASIKNLLALYGFKIIYSRTIQPVNYFFDSFYSPLRHFLWSNLKKMLRNNNKNKINNEVSHSQRGSEQLSPEEELKIDKSIKSKLFRLEIMIKKLLSLPFYPYSWWISKKNEGDILQIIAIVEN